VMQKDLSVEFGSENAGRSFRRSETRLSTGLTPFHHPTRVLPHLLVAGVPSAPTLRYDRSAFHHSFLRSAGSGCHLPKAAGNVTPVNLSDLQRPA
jgi:hypothetical protein